MKPQPMSDAEIDSIIYASRQADEGPSALARRFAAARDAQWAAMIGEPVAAVHFAHKKPELRQLSWRLPVPKELKSKGWVASPLYAIKETP